MAELDPRTALEHARTMKRFVEAFNGQKFDPVFDEMDRRNLAVALDNLEETAAMLLNMAERVSPSAAAPVAQGEVPSDAKDARYAVAMLNYSFELNILAMQAAYIEWTRSGAEEAMKWIGNTLDGPGLIPDADEPPTAQAYFGRERKLIEERFDAARAALSTPSPAAPTSDAEDALRFLVEQIEKGALVDDHGHLFINNIAFIKAKGLL